MNGNRIVISLVSNIMYSVWLTYSTIDMISIRHKSGNLWEMRQISNYSGSAGKYCALNMFCTYRMLSSVYVFGTSKRSGEMLLRNSNFWNVIFAETVGSIGISIFTGNPLGSFNVTNSRSFVKCLNGAITSSTFNSISTVNGNSLLCVVKWKKRRRTT